MSHALIHLHDLLCAGLMWVHPQNAGRINARQNCICSAVLLCDDALSNMLQACSALTAWRFVLSIPGGVQSGLRERLFADLLHCNAQRQ